MNSNIPEITPEIQNTTAAPVTSSRRISSRIAERNRLDQIASNNLTLNKRKVTKIPDSEKEKLTELWAIHGYRWTPEDYSLELNIRLDVVKRYVRNLANNIPLIKERKKRGRHTIITPQMSRKMKNMFIIDPKLTLGDACMVISDSSSTSIFERDIDTYNVSLEVQTAAIEELRNLKGSNTPPVCSKSTIAKHLHSSKMADHVGTSFNIKKLYKRGPNSNNDENKQRRKDVYEEIDRMISNGIRIIYIDEVHWSFNNYTQYGWGKTGEKIYYQNISKRLSLTALATISSSGVGYTELLGNTVTGDVFCNFLTNALEHYVADDASTCIYMDNAPVHQKGRINDICNQFNVSVIYGPKYTPDMNPIENIFGIWKQRAEVKIKQWNGLDDFIEKISEEWKSIDAATIRKSINHVMGEIREMVNADKDL
ncbi:hypothetical protein WA158_005849 [Blastocystis sp. Blastoise]